MPRQLTNLLKDLSSLLQFRVYILHTFPQQQANRHHLVFGSCTFFDAPQQQIHALLCQLFHALGYGGKTRDGVFTDFQAVKADDRNLLGNQFPCILQRTDGT